MISEITIFVSEEISGECSQIIHAEIGTGDNLLPEDSAEGYVGYLNLNRYMAEPCEAEDDRIAFEFYDGDMALLKDIPETKEEFLLALAEYLGTRKDEIVVLAAV